MSAKPDWRYADDGRPRVPASRSEGTDLRINPSACVYVMGNVRTNSIDNFWSLVKRGLPPSNPSAAEELVEDPFLFPEDADAYICAAEASNVLKLVPDEDRDDDDVE